jgi:hypothetical protein
MYGPFYIFIHVFCKFKYEYPPLAFIIIYMQGFDLEVSIIHL